MDYIGYLLLDITVTTGAMYLACKLTGVRIEPIWLLAAVVASSVVSFVPIVGWPASLCVLFWVLNEYSNAKVWPDLIFMVVLSRLFSLIFVMPLL